MGRKVGDDDDDDVSKTVLPETPCTNALDESAHKNEIPSNAPTRIFGVTSFVRDLIGFFYNCEDEIGCSRDSDEGMSTATRLSIADASFLSTAKIFATIEKSCEF